MRRLKTLAIVGVGLIGGSFALALRRAGVATRIVGFDRDRAALEAAASLGAIDTAAESVSEAVQGADLVVIAVPVRSVGPVLHDVALAMNDDTIVTDVGSTKAEVVKVAREELRERFRRFVPGHPIAGRETSGVESALADLFRGARVVLTPVPETAADALDTVRSAWESVGGRVALADAADHDRIFAAVSHLPHILAFAYFNSVSRQPAGRDYLSLGGPGFRDFTRIAASNPAVWRDILMANREEILKQTARFRHTLDAMEHVIKTGNTEALEALVRSASDARAGWQMNSATPHTHR
jgi:prephenate dehydrogenase